jgi:hypothetical protein
MKRGRKALFVWDFDDEARQHPQSNVCFAPLAAKAHYSSEAVATPKGSPDILGM